MKTWINYLLGAGSVLEIAPPPVRNRFGRHLFGDSIEDDLRGDVEQIGHDMWGAIRVSVQGLPDDDEPDARIGPVGDAQRIGESAGGDVPADRQAHPEKGQGTFGWFA